MKLTFEIKLMNRVKPVGMEGYKKVWKPPMRLRNTDSDHLNRFNKQSDREIADYDARRSWSEEINRLKEETPWQIKNNPDFGDMLIGTVTTVEFSDFYTEIYVNQKSL